MMGKATFFILFGLIAFISMEELSSSNFTNSEEKKMKEEVVRDGKGKF